MAENLHIGVIAEGDEAAVIALWEACGLTRPWNDPAWDLEFARAGQASAVLVGRQHGALVAAAMVGHDGHRGAVYYLAVAAAHRGRGHGRAMMAAVEAWLRARGILKINLAVRTDNKAVFGFYAALGYEVQETVMLSKWIDGRG